MFGVPSVQSLFMKSGLPVIALFLSLQLTGQTTPDKIYGELFHDIQMARIFPDGKTFVDMVPRQKVSDILKEYKTIKKNPPADFSLDRFAKERFELPASAQQSYHTTGQDVVKHIHELWTVLKRNPDKQVEGSSLLPLPHPYIVPGGRFREVYYWDSYFTMLGLKESGETGVIEDMVRNFAYMIRTYGHIPNGNRTYYLSRSQPPFFPLMVELLADIKGDAVFGEYLDALEKEYQYWMQGAEKLANGQSESRVVRMADGAIMNRYWDDLDIPRQESYREDVETVERAIKAMLARSTFPNSKAQEAAERELRSTLSRHLRAGAASGWDFSSRWFSDKATIQTIRTTRMVPVDLNCLLYQMELTLKKAYTRATPGKPDQAAKYTATAGLYDKKASARKAAIEKYCWNDAAGTYADYDLDRQATDTQVHMGGAFPLFFQVADRTHGAKAARTLVDRLMKEGGFVTTEIRSGQQWDAPNGWAPLQWVAILGLEKYEYFDEARQAATRWVKLNRDVFSRTGKLMEKYNVLDTGLDAGGGEYPSQDGFGWTNGVLLALMRKYNID
jgi:alpha,alpha-trehalase